jgi:hypothetical protein
VLPLDPRGSPAEPCAVAHLIETPEPIIIR